MPLAMIGDEGERHKSLRDLAAETRRAQRAARAAPACRPSARVRLSASWAAACSCVRTRGQHTCLVHHHGAGCKAYQELAELARRHRRDHR